MANQNTTPFQRLKDCHLHFESQYVLHKHELLICGDHRQRSYLPTKNVIQHHRFVLKPKNEQGMKKKEKNYEMLYFVKIITFFNFMHLYYVNSIKKGHGLHLKIFCLFTYCFAILNDDNSYIHIIERNNEYALSVHMKTKVSEWMDSQQLVISLLTFFWKLSYFFLYETINSQRMM
ncbi:hypothetical protein RFI_02562 [Reticulomyxa filosa]|uniref:Uncharacterized protein n=1 Tax=Reticulomyxa filosa TaxID=46433 RepID=X6P8K5_RETFI|nr:hypothetical protein RFI_02562 [Reticulomyxa filosa]|eukprot:ETO34531.1 hypothetical protein RFI_02562 [Reticulomyxa filosa]